MRKIINLLQDDWLSKQFTKKDCKTGRISGDAVHVLGQESQDSFTDREYRNDYETWDTTYICKGTGSKVCRIASDSRAGLHS